MNVFESSEQFAAWVVDQSRRYTVNLQATPIVARDEILCAAGEWPDASLREIDASAERSMERACQSHEGEVSCQISSLRCELQAALDPLFAVNTNSRTAKRKEALTCVRKFLGRLQSDSASWEQLGAPMQFVLLLPICKKVEMRSLMKHLDGDFKRVWWSAIETALGQTRELLSREAPRGINQRVSARQSRERERALANSYRRLVQRWRSQTRFRKMTIRPSDRDSRIFMRFDIAESFPQTTPMFDPFGGPCGPSRVVVRHPTESLTLGRFFGEFRASSNPVSLWDSDDEVESSSGGEDFCNGYGSSESTT